MSNRLVASAVLLLAGVFAAHGAGCSVIVDSKPQQCTTDGDCRARGATFVDSFCGAAGACVRSVDYCATNVECIERLGNEASICRKSDHTCVALVTKQCKLLADKDDLRNDETVIIGSHGIPSWSSQTQACESALELVRRDFKSTQGGLPPSPTSGGNPRPVVFLSCDVPIGQQELHKAVSDHLFDNVKVPVSIGPFASIDMTTYGVQKAIAAGATMLSVAEDQVAYQIPGRVGSVFFFGLPVGAIITGYAQGVSLIEPVIRAKVPDAATRPLKVAFVYPSTGAAETEAQQMFAQVRFNGGKSAMENGPTLYKEFQFTPPSADPNFQEGFANLSLSVKAFNPDVVILRGADEVVPLGTLIESANPNKSYFLLAIEARGAVISWVGSNESLRKRILGVRPGRYEQDPRILRVNQRYLAAGFEAAPSPLMRACVDMAYAALYAAGAVVDGPPTGKKVGQALLTKFTDSGTPIEASPSSILRGFAAAQGQQDLALAGNESAVVWDKTTGVKVDWELQYWCVDPDVNKPDRLYDSGVTYTGRTKTLSGGTPDCKF
jgi:hypothetical protein